jgi:chemotaxis protein CheX
MVPATGDATHREILLGKKTVNRTTATMKAEYIEPFVSAAVNTFGTMLDCELKPKAPLLDRKTQAENDVCGVIGLSGRGKGTVVLSLCREAALSAAGAMLGQRPAEIDADVTDAIGELANMIAGAAKAKLHHWELNASLPAVIVGKNHMVEFPKTVEPVCVPYECPWGYVAVEVGLIEPQENETQNPA